MSRPAVDLEALPGEWLPVASDASDHLVRELNRELPAGHVLQGVRFEPVARRVKRDDVVWWLSDSDEWALVHLSYSAEHDPRWPSCCVFPTWEALVSALDDW